MANKEDIRWLPKSGVSVENGHVVGVEPWVAEKHGFPVNGNSPKGERQYLNVPYDQREKAKAAGAKWVEKAMRNIGGGERRELVRPESVGLPVHVLKTVEEPTRYPPQSDIIADNLPEADEEKPKVVRAKKVTE